MVKKIILISNKKFLSRLIVGTENIEILRNVQRLKSIWAEIVTVAVRRVNISDKKKPLLMDYLNPKK